MKRILLIALALISGICSAQTFKVQNLSVLGTSTLTGLATFSVRPVFNGNTPWDSGNLTPGNYALLSGATFTGPVVIPLGSSLPRADDIRNYGAVCNSSASQAANNTAISSALTNQGSAFIPPCSIYASNTTLASGQRVWGVGPASNLIAFGTLSATGLINCTGCAGFAVDHINISVNSTQRTAGVSGITCTTCSGMMVDHNVVQGNYAILAAGSTNTSITNNSITAYGENSGTNGSGDGIAIQGTAVDAHGFNCAGTQSQVGTVAGNWVTGASSSANPPTPFGINICGATGITVSGNTLLSPGYFGIIIQGATALNNVINGNTISNPVHEGIINTDGASQTTISGNFIIDGASSLDYCLTIDGSQGAMIGISVTGNNLLNCHSSGLTALYSVSQSSFVGNVITNPNTGGITAQAGIQTYGTNFQFNQFASNTVTNNPSAAGYGINETTDGISGFPSHNVYMSNSTVGMTTAPFNIQATSTSNNNISYP